MDLWRFIPWSFEPNNTFMQKEGTVTTGAGGIQAY